MKTKKHKIGLSLIGFLLIISLTVQAQGIKIANATFKAAGDVNIVVKDGGLSNSGTYTKAAETLILTGTTAASLGGASVTSINNLQIDNPIGVSLAGIVNVSNLLSLNQGIVYLGTYDLILGTSATAPVTTPTPLSWVDATASGRLKKMFATNQAFTFPVGNGGATPAYSPVNLALTASDFSNSWVGVKLKNEVHPNNPHALPNYPNYLKRYWDIASSGLTTPSYNATFNYVQTDVAGSEDSLQAASRYGSSSSWKRFGSSNTIANYFTISNISNFYEFTGVQSYRPPSSISLYGPTSVTASTESGNFTIQVYDTYGDTTLVRSNTQFALSTTSTGITRIFNPNNPIVAQNFGSTTFTYKDSQIGIPTITASRTAGDAGLTGKSAIRSIDVNLHPWEICNTSPSANGVTDYFPDGSAIPVYGNLRLTATGQSTTSNDVFHFVYQPLTGNGTVVARLDDVQNGGWAGVMMRESNSPGAKTILFKTRLYNPNVFIGYRTTTNKNMVNLSQVAQLIHWMKIQRNGNVFKVFTSYNGTTWMQRYSGTIAMGNCINAGIFTESVRSDRTSIAWFDNVELAGYLKTGEIETIEIPDDSQNGHSEVEIYPNPAKEKVNIIYPYNGTSVTLTMVSVNGKIVKTLSITANETQIDVSALLPGVYVLRMQSNESIVTRRLVIQ